MVLIHFMYNILFSLKNDHSWQIFNIKSSTFLKIIYFNIIVYVNIFGIYGNMFN